MPGATTGLPPPLDAALERLLGALNLPTRHDLSRLEAKIDELERLLDEIEAKADRVVRSAESTQADT